ncbi:TetR/AcrR family transcriptional regulator [Lentzea sp. HUAS12]|uniref:TetR/AcrR family transcriptional regulator n=1 Tax=Lentzea sp. HUAS12 TaxID=2951806 RepID=UPI00209D9490|nr:TetR family transcriptional regulator C-terminal domain-containing protein [Lentzea sp. HUAS12]USX54143.1 TetR family transcriptional regulator C-terminal domain-containing protein [Lentzea sp. HUAS12]
MPKHADPVERRQQVVAALYRVVDAEGLDAASLPRIARELDATTGLLQKYFRSKDELLLFAQDQLVEELTASVQEVLNQEGGLQDQLREALCAIALVGDPARARVWLAFAARAAANPVLLERHKQGAQVVRDLCRHVLEAAGVDGEEAVGLAALVDGVTAQRALEPEEMTEEVAERVIARHLERLWGST